MYRDAPLTGAACYKHAAAPMAADVRSAAARALRSVHRLRPLVAALHRLRARGAAAALDRRRGEDRRRPRRRRRRHRLRGHAPAARSTTAPTDRDIVQLHNKVAAERCDKQRDPRVRRGARSPPATARGALADTDAYFARVRRLVSPALGDLLARTSRSASTPPPPPRRRKLIEHDPQDHDYPWWRGVAYEEMGRIDEAIADYRRTLTLAAGSSTASRSTSPTCSSRRASSARRASRSCSSCSSIPQFAAQPNVVDRLDPAAHPRPLPADPTSTLDVAVEPDVDRVLRQRADLLIELERPAKQLERGDRTDRVHRRDARVLVDVDLHDLELARRAPARSPRAPAPPRDTARTTAPRSRRAPGSASPRPRRARSRRCRPPARAGRPSACTCRSVGSSLRRA